MYSLIVKTFTYQNFQNFHKLLIYCKNFGLIVYLIKRRYKKLVALKVFTRVNINLFYTSKMRSTLVGFLGNWFSIYIIWISDFLSGGIFSELSKNVTLVISLYKCLEILTRINKILPITFYLMTNSHQSYILYYRILSTRISQLLILLKSYLFDDRNYTCHKINRVLGQKVLVHKRCR